MYSTSAECLQNVHCFLCFGGGVCCYFRGGGGGGGGWHCILVSCVTSPIFVFVYFPLNKKRWQNKTHCFSGKTLELGRKKANSVISEFLHLSFADMNGPKARLSVLDEFCESLFFPSHINAHKKKKLIAMSDKQSLNQWLAEWVYVWTFHSTLQAPKHLANQQQWYWSTLWTCLKHFCCTKADKIRPKWNTDICWCFPFMCTYL